MTTLIITDVKYSTWKLGQDIITAVIAGSESENFYHFLTQVKEFCQCQMILESATAIYDQPEIGVKKGDFYFRMWSNLDHGLKAGDELVLFDSMG